MGDEIEVTMDCDKCQEFQYNKGIDDFMDMLKNQWTIDSILCATDKYRLIAIFKRIAEQLKEQSHE